MPNLYDFKWFSLGLLFCICYMRFEGLRKGCNGLRCLLTRGWIWLGGWAHGFQNACDKQNSNPRYLDLLWVWFEYVILYANKAFADVKPGPWEVKIVLSYPGGVNVIIRLVMKGRQAGEVSRWSASCWLWRKRKGVVEAFRKSENTGSSPEFKN